MERLNDSARVLDIVRVRKCIDAVIKGYEEATDVRYMARIVGERSIEEYRFRSIGLHRGIEERKFLARDYFWDIYFADVGRAIATGERKYLHRRIGAFAEYFSESIHYEDPDFRVINDGITMLRDNRIRPDVLLIPIEVYAKFLKYYWSQLEWSSGRPKLMAEGSQLDVFWSNKYAPLRSCILFDSNAGEWHVLKDDNGSRNIMVVIGKSEEKRGTVEYLVETLAYYKVMNKEGYLKIRLLGERKKLG